MKWFCTRMIFSRPSWGWITVMLGLAFFTACQTSTAVTAEQSQLTPTATVTLQPPSVSTLETSPPITPTSTPENSKMTLTFWMVEPISPRAEGEAGEFIDNNLRAFERANPNIKVEILLKKASGKGGMLDFLRTARDAAPSVLPDMVVMNATDLGQASADSLIQPLDGRLNRSILQDLLPAARKMGTVNEQLFGLPLGLEMEHTVYNTRVFTNTPLLWTNILSSNTKYLFPAKGINGLINDATLSEYFSAGGKLLDEQGDPILDERALRSVLDFYYQALEKGVIDSQILQAATSEELWPAHLSAQAGITSVSVHQYLANRDSLENTVFAPVPVPREKDTPVAITRGWVLALVASDPNRQGPALSLMEWFLSTSNNVTWNNINKSIPTRDTSYQQLAKDDPYWLFLTEQLNTAQPQPAFNGYDHLARIIQQAVEQVVSGEATPEEATATAMDTLTQ